MKTALSLLTKALVMEELLKHSDVNGPVTMQKSPLKSTKNKGIQDETLTMGNKIKQTLGKEKASWTLEYGKNLVGSKVKVWWPNDQMFYDGIIASFDPVKDKHKILYTDGDIEILNLRIERWEFVEDDLFSDGGTVTLQKSPLKSTKNEGIQDEISTMSNKRQQTPGQEKASGTLVCGENLVGSKVKIWWPNDQMFYEGVIASFDPVKTKHKILYTDGDIEILNLRMERWEFVGDDLFSDGGTVTPQKSPPKSTKNEGIKDETPTMSNKRKQTPGQEKGTVAPQKSPLKSTKNEGIKDETPTISNKRKQTPGEEKASGTLVYGENLVGSKVKVWWLNDQMFYEGVIASFDPVKEKHKILYTDGDIEILNLRKERWKFVGDRVQGVKHSCHDTSSDMQRTKKGNTNFETSSKRQKVDGSPKSNLDITTISGGKSKHDGKAESEFKDNYSKPSKKSVDENIKSQDQSQKLGGKGQVDSAKVSGRSKDAVVKISSHLKQDSQQTSKSKGSNDQCPILFVWDGEWDYDMTSHRWRFIGKHAKTALVPSDMTFSQLLDKAYTVSKVNINEYEIEMSSWFAYQYYQDPLPPCPLVDDEDVQILLRANTEKYMSVPLCLITRERKVVGKLQCRISLESSNHDCVPIDTHSSNRDCVPDTRKCDRYGGTGHHRKTCETPIPVQSSCAVPP